MEIKSKTNIGGLEFEWDLEKGNFLFEGEDAVLFWISSAMRTFFDTIEEISGEEASNLVFETTGFRQGLVVGQYFEKIKDVSIAQAAELITNTYASAGWGRTTIKNLDFESKTLTAHIQDSWEYKINLAQEKKQGGNYLPAHYAGIFTGLFGTNIWYKVVQHQLEGHKYSVIEYFPSDVTITNNIHQLARKKEAEEILRLEALVEEKTSELKELVKELSSPIIPVLEGIVVVPLLGKYDEERSEELVVKTLNNLPAHKANYLVLDLTGLDKDISEHTVSLIEKIGSAASLIGTDTILVGISAELGMIISQSTINFSRFDCFQTLQHGIYFALGQHGRKII
ncbi:STAS domain-containing protein [Domibacillus iocasae]|uniref:Anti-anti-sigma factor n=1 Tax=Domibacillus iocasae TaxID=1714016 RepID=A0A1E7DQ41_9BACI|nr:STAS domain-containing protein [Domibacillus iocasae]OES45202.1 anti-anti-sigma factor [Domibacillus iocasae]